MKKQIRLCLNLLFLMACGSVLAEIETDIVIATNMIRQTSANGTNYFAGKVGVGTSEPAAKFHVVGNSQVDGAMTVTGAMKVPRQGDVSMGVYTNGEAVDGISGGGGVTNHASLNGLSWTNSGHTGTSGKYAGFDTSGNAALLDGGGGGGVAISNLFWVNKNNVNQGSAGDTVFSKITFTNEVYDSFGWWDAPNSRLTVQKSAKYQFTASAGGGGRYGSTYICLSFCVNGQKKQVGPDTITYSTGNRGNLVSFAPMDLASNDYVEIYGIINDSYSSGYILGNVTNTWFAGWIYNQ
ncbi:MAG: hypothetical protein A2498_06030 [Lentisphaerae bacterium RIFOXYC12_FULL_60_16]|nr:MAG: hypothetical protein A2498_06030 [Lentisphaerae bacterium RIFOXYC12_FULL_60_16]